MSLLGLALVVFFVCILIGLIIWAWPQVQAPAMIKNAFLIALIVVCFIVLIWLLVGGLGGLGGIRLGRIGGLPALFPVG